MSLPQKGHWFALNALEITNGALQPLPKHLEALTSILKEKLLSYENLSTARHGIKNFKGRLEIYAPIERVAHVLFDPETQGRWIGGLMNVSLLEIDSTEHWANVPKNLSTLSGISSTKSDLGPWLCFGRWMECWFWRWSCAQSGTAFAVHYAWRLSRARWSRSPL